MRILITGQNSYAGRKFIERMRGKKNILEIDAISVRDDSWKYLNFSNYDAIYHVAAIVHLKEKLEMKQEYYRVNSELPFKIAEKAKNEGVKSFVFLSSIAVYGNLGEIGKDIIISKETKENPKTLNGKSKLAAEKLLIPLQSENFNIAILRIPLIYGPDCPGNYSSLSKLAKITPIFPSVNNERSMVFIDHLSDIVAHIIIRELKGTFLINNPENFRTIDVVRNIANIHGKKLYESKLAELFLRVFGNNFDVLKKIFGTVHYDLNDTKITDFKYCDISFEKTLQLSETKSRCQLSRRI